MFLLIGGMLAVLAGWPVLRNVWESLTTGTPTGAAISGDTEYWCPMCPGVTSDWPSKCPVCSMTLVRREKGEMTPLPDGVVARVQLSPYRIQLAGIRTVPVEFRRLEHEVIVAGFLELPPGSSGTAPPLSLTADVFETDAVVLTTGQLGSLECATSVDETPVRIMDVSPTTMPYSGRRVHVRVDNPRGELRPGQYATARFRTPVAQLDTARRVEYQRWGEQTAISLLGGPDAALTSLISVAVRQVAAHDGQTLCVPEPAVIDTGNRRVVYRESMPGVYDAVEVKLGRRYGTYYPVRGGLEPGQRVAAAGAVLLDAETRLDPSIAATYFGAGTRSAAPSTEPPPASGSTPESNEQIARRQKVCPVTGAPLDSMGGPVRVSVAGRPVLICCKGCEKPLLKKPDQFLATLPK